MLPVEFTRRRQELMGKIGNGNIAIITSAVQQIRNKDIHFPFRQDSDFYYLTSINEADALAVFIPQQGDIPDQYILFCREFDAKKALWEGANIGLAGAVSQYGASDAFPISDIDDILPGILEGKRKIYYPLGASSAMDCQLIDWINQLKQKSRNGVAAPVELVSLEQILHEMRLFKSPAEIQHLRRASEVSVCAHIRAMQACRVGMNECQIEGEIIHEFMQHGLRNTAYPCIVAGGKNSCVLHYTDNSSQLVDGDLLLIDAGAECQHYAADITRTFPVSGKFSDAQKQLYQLVLDAQLATIAEVAPNTPWNKLHDVSVQVITAGLVQLGLLQGSVASLIADKKYQQFYMHKIGHWLGMDVHDVGDYKIDGEWRLLEEGMVLTVEPGIYIAPDTAVAPKWRGIGIRIEDDILVTENGCEVLTQSLPKEIAAIEQLMRG